MILIVEEIIKNDLLVELSINEKWAMTGVNVWFSLLPGVCSDRPVCRIQLFWQDVVFLFFFLFLSRAFIHRLYSLSLALSYPHYAPYTHLVVSANWRLALPTRWIIWIFLLLSLYHWWKSISTRLSQIIEKKHMFTLRTIKTVVIINSQSCCCLFY